MIYGKSSCRLSSFYRTIHLPSISERMTMNHHEFLSDIKISKYLSIVVSWKQLRSFSSINHVYISNNWESSERYKRIIANFLEGIDCVIVLLTSSNICHNRRMLFACELFCNSFSHLQNQFNWVSNNRMILIKIFNQPLNRK